jgi:hypothetical protein
LLQHASNLRDEAASGLQKVNQQLDDFGQQSNQRLESLSSDIERAAGLLATNYEQRIVHDISPSTDDNVQGVASGIDAFRSAADAVQSQFDSGVGDALEKISEIAQLLDDIKPVIDLVETMA